MREVHSSDDGADFGGTSLPRALDSVTYRPPSSSSLLLEIRHSLGEWVVRIIGRNGETYSRAFENEADAVAFAGDQSSRLGLEAPPKRAT